jgi:hypothetical protein
VAQDRDGGKKAKGGCLSCSDSGATKEEEEEEWGHYIRHFGRWILNTTWAYLKISETMTSLGQITYLQALNNNSAVNGKDFIKIANLDTFYCIS